jgi:DNA transformation protein
MRDDSFRDFVMEQLAGIKPVDCRAMFGGYGLYKNGIMFGIIHKSRLYFKVFDVTRPSYVEAGMQSFNPFKKTTLKSFFEVPADVSESPPQITEWVRLAVQSANTKKSAPSKIRPSLKPEHILTGHSIKIKSLSNRLRGVIKKTVPGATEHAYPGWHAIGYRHPSTGYFCGIFPFENNAKLYFEHGARISDPKKILEGNQKQIRFITLRTASQIRPTVLKDFLLQTI